MRALSLTILGILLSSFYLKASNVIDSIKIGSDEGVGVIKKYIVGNIGKRTVIDTAILVYQQETLPDGSIETIDNISVIRFSSHIPSIVIQPTNSVHIQKAVDFNNDGRNEIIIYSAWPNGYWNDLYVYTLANQTWKVVLKAKAFISEDKDYLNRIFKDNVNRCYWIVEDYVNDNGDFIKRRIKIPSKF